MPSPVIVAAGTGQVAEGLQNTWGLEEEDEEEEFQGGTDEKKKKKGTVCMCFWVCMSAVLALHMKLSCN